MNYISKVFSPRVNLTRLDSNEITKIVPPTNHQQNLITEQNKTTQAFRRSQVTTDIDLNNIGNPPIGVRS